MSLQEDQFRVVSDWYHFAILNLAKLKRNRATPEWIAERLGISRIESRSGMLTLQRLGYLKIEKGKLVRTAVPLFFRPSDMPSALKKFQKQQLQLAERSLERDPVDKRYITSFILPTDPERLLEAKALLLKYQRKVMEFLENGNSTEVYSLSIQLFPLSHSKENS